MLLNGFVIDVGLNLVNRTSAMNVTRMICLILIRGTLRRRIGTRFRPSVIKNINEFELDRFSSRIIKKISLIFAILRKYSLCFDYLHKENNQ